MTPYERIVPCPKCGAPRTRVKYERTMLDLGGHYEEWLRRECPECGYWTSEPCADAEADA